MSTNLHWRIATMRQDAVVEVIKVRTMWQPEALIDRKYKFHPMQLLVNNFCIALCAGALSWRNAKISFQVTITLVVSCLWHEHHKNWTTNLSAWIYDSFEHGMAELLNSTAASNIRTLWCGGTSPSSRHCIYIWNTLPTLSPNAKFSLQEHFFLQWCIAAVTVKSYCMYLFYILSQAK